MERNGVFTYLHGDHLGSTIAETGVVGSDNGKIVNKREYNPYGSRRSGSTQLNTDRTYTGQQSDETGLMYYNARYYDPQIGQLISPDTIVPDPGNVLDYNRYAYVRGNPLRYIDDSGNTPWDVVDIGLWALSLKDLYNEPSWGNTGWFALDTLSLLPVMPSFSYVRRGGKLVFNLTADAAKHSDEVANLVNGLQKSVPAGRTLTEISKSSLETIHKYGIDSFKNFPSPREPAGNHVHHLVEKRFSDQLGFATFEDGKAQILSVSIGREIHTQITGALRTKIGPKAATSNASLQDIWNAHKDVYADFGLDEWSELIWDVCFDHVPDLIK